MEYIEGGIGQDTRQRAPECAMPVREIEYHSGIPLP